MFPILLDTIAKARRALGAWLGFRPVFRAAGGIIFARAHPEQVRFTESYQYSQVISRNPAANMAGEPAGELEVRVPYDGERYFTRAALADVKHGIQSRSGQTEVLIGHLALAGRSRTDLDSRLPLGDQHGCLPLQVLLPDPDDLDRLVADRDECVTRQDYVPDAPRLIPITVDCKLEDPDSFNLLDLEDLARRLEWEDPDAEQELADELADVAARITKSATFEPHLMIRIQVTLQLPRPPKDPESQDSQDSQDAQATVARVALEWPTVTSIGSTTLEVGRRKRPLRYNPLIQSLEWFDVSMRTDRGASDDDVVTYRSLDMRLLVVQPGELYQQSVMNGQVDVEISNYLLSGLAVRRYDGTGIRRPGPELTTKISTELRIVLDDAFALRKLSPHQHWYFEEIIPDDMRIADLITTLVDSRFRLRKRKLVDPETDTHIVLVSRSEGPETMYLLFVIRGHRYETERENQVSGGPTYKSNFDSGDLQVFVYGQLPGDSREITHEINAVHRALRERFDRLRARR